MKTFIQLAAGICLATLSFGAFAQITYTQIGDTTFGSDGSTYTKI